MSFVRRNIEVVLQVGQDYDANNIPRSYESWTLNGLRTSVSISKSGLPGTSQANIRIYGLTMGDMTRVAGLNPTVIAKNNKVVINAGDDVSGMATAFAGGILIAHVDMSSAPDVSLIIVAQEALYFDQIPAKPLSYPDSARPSDILADLASQMGLEFENSVPASDPADNPLKTPYFVGSPRYQAISCADAAGINMIIDNGVLAIWPRSGYRVGQLPLISKATGMIGYPSFSNIGISVNCLYNPWLRFGERVKVESGLQAANGEWGVMMISHELESETQGGKWFTKFDAVPDGYALK